MTTTMQERARVLVTTCDPRRCEFTTSKVRAYLVCWREARVHDESFVEVLRARFRNSRHSDPGIRGTRVDPMDAVLIGVALQEAQRAGLSMSAHNAEKVAAWLCSNEHVEEEPE